MQKSFFFLLSVALLISSSCSKKTVDEQYYCHKEELIKIKPSLNYAYLMKSLRDTLSNWINDSLKGVQDLSWNKWEISDDVLFNKDSTKCLLFYSLIDRDTSVSFAGVQIIGAEIIKPYWHFYVQSYPRILFNRDEVSPRATFNSQNMFDKTIKDIIQDGYYFQGKCEINYSYIDSDIWFADWIRKKHQVFLQNK